MAEYVQRPITSPLRGGSITLPDTTSDLIKEEVSKATNQSMKETKDELKKVTVQLAEKASKQELQNIGSATPKGTYATLSALQTAFPTGTSGIYVVTADGKWYFWNGTAWTAGGQYQSTGIADNSVTPKQTTFLSTGKNLFDITNSTVNALNIRGEVVANANYLVSPFERVEPDRIIYVSNNFYGTQIKSPNMYRVAYYDADNKFIGLISKVDNVGAEFIVESTSTYMTALRVPSNAKLMRFMLDKKYENNKLQVEYDSVTEYEEYGYRIPKLLENRKIEKINQDVTTLKEDVETVKNVGVIKTKDKNFLIFGDSITETATIGEDGSNYREGYYTNWPTYAKDKLKWGSMWNYARAGARYADRIVEGDRRKSFSEQVKMAIANQSVTPDIIIVSLGANDGSTPMGDYDSAMNKPIESLDRNIIYEAIRWGFWTIRQKYPNAVCFVGTPIQRANIEPYKGLIDAITRMGNRYNFIVINGAYESGIIRDFEVDNGQGRYLADGLHPNDEGKRKLSNLYVRTILNAMNY